jgi:hypothetical protein
MAARETTMKATRWIIATFALALACQASAASPVEQLKGRWAFNWASDPAKTKCARVEGELLKTFQSKAYACSVTEVTNTSTGAATADCKRSRPDKDYLIFRTKALCEAERLQQAANGD